MNVLDIYNINVELTYYKELNDDDDNDDEELIDLYKKEILKVFYLKEYNSEIIDKSQMLIFSDLIKNERIKKFTKILANKYLSEDLDFGFVVLFSYNYFYFLHKCIQSYYTKGYIESNLLDELENKINLIF